jgi:hypothetical protein
MTDLNDLLALLPDNTTGDIGADDLRTIVTELWHQASIYGNSYLFKWDANPPPAAGQITMDQPWQMFATKILVSNTTSDGLTLTFDLLDNSTETKFLLATKAGGKLQATVTGDSVDFGSYREVPITVASMSGTPPSGNDNVTVTILAAVA